MPKPIPPPPPQPTLEETHQAVRWALGLLMTTVGFFWLLSLSYHPKAAILDYGRSSSLEWILYRAQNLDTKRYRSHNNGKGKIIWLVGSSTIRESFDEKIINRELNIQESEYRIVKLGTNRGGAGIVAGLFQYLDVQQGDIVVHNVPPNSYKQNWLDYAAFPSYDLMLVKDSSEFWDINSWNLAEKLEQASAIPFQYWAHHNMVMKGLTRWIVYGMSLELPPPKRGPRHYLTYHRHEFRDFELRKDSANYIGKEGMDFSDEQFNIQGLRKIAAFCAEKDVELRLIYIPARQAYLAEMIHQDTLAQYQTFLESLDEEVYFFPQQPEDDYLDSIHPNFRGRKALTEYFIGWVDSPQKGKFPSITWDIPEYNR